MRFPTNNVPIRYKIESQVSIVPITGCWLWMGYIGKNGYGVVWNKDKYKKELAHRASYEMFKGSLDECLEIDHLCRNRWCINPDHLEQVTSLENGRRSPISKSGGKPFCHNGHEMLDGSFYIRVKKNGYVGRQCKKCQAISESKRRDERNARRRLMRRSKRMMEVS